MWWLTCAVIYSLVYISQCQNVSLSDEELERMYHDAVASVLAQHAEASSSPRSPPYFNMPEDFMHSFVPGTGVGNREEVVIDGIFPLPVFEDAMFSRYIFKHFNNTDYVAGISENYMVLMKVNASVDDYFVLSKDDAVITYYTESGVIKDVVLFSRIAGNLEILSVAIATETSKTTVIYIYEVIGDIGGVMVSMIDLNMDPSKTSNSVKKIGYAQSSHGGSLVVLVETTWEKKLNYVQRGHSKLNHYIEVNYPAAVDLATFSVHGHGYIAVASSTFCDIFKLDEFVGSHILFDRLGPYSAIVDLEYFRLGFHHFLTVVDFERQHMYSWKKGEFSLKQTLHVANAAQVYAASTESCRDEVMLLTITWDGKADLHIFSGTNEDFKKVDVVIPEGFSIQPGSLTSFTSRDSVVILFRDVSSKLEALVIKTSLTSLRDPVLSEGEEVSKMMKSIQDLINSQKKEMKLLKRMLKNAVRNNETLHINSVQHFNSINATNVIVAKTNDFAIKWDDSVLTLEEYKLGAEDLEKAIISLESVVAEIENTLPDVVRIDEDAFITGQKIFKGIVQADNLVTKSLSLQNVAGVDLPKLQKEIYRLDNPEIIQGTLTFKEPLTVTGNFDVGTTVNGIDISEEVMTTDTEQTSFAEMVFLKPVVIKGDLEVSGKINNIDISEEVVTIDGSQSITAPKNFLNGIQAQNVETKFLDGIDIDDLYLRALTKSGKQTITSDVSFSSVTTNNIVLNGKLNGYDVKELASNIVRVDQPAIITGYKVFTNDVKIEGELTVQGTVNGLRIPDDLVFSDKHKVITGTKEFLGLVTADDVVVQGLVDGLKLPEDIVTLSKDEVVESSILYFADGIVAEKDIIVEGLVDGVDISEIAKQAVTLNGSNTFDRAVFNGPVTITGNLNVKGLVNGVDLNGLIGDVVYKDEKPIVINAKKSFEKIVVGKVKLDNSINGYNIDADFMKVRGDQNISGTKTFKKTVFNSVNIQDGMIDGIDIADLYKRSIKLEIETEDPIDKEIEFVDNVIVKNLEVRGTINGLRIPEDIVLRNSTEPISNKHFAGRVTVDNLIIGGSVTADYFGGVNLTQFHDERITLTGDQDIPGDLLLGNVSASEISISGLVNGVDIEDFAKNVMSKSKPYQVVTGDKEFSGHVTVVGDIQTEEGVNGFNLSDVRRRAVKLYEDNVVTAPFDFEDNVTFTDVFVDGDINGVNLTRLNEDSLKKTGDIQYVKGDTHFKAGFDVVGDISATKVNGLTLVEDILLKDVPQTIKGQFTFENLAVDGDLTVKGRINGLNLAEVVPKLARLEEEAIVIESNVEFTNYVRVYDNIEVSGTVNEVDLKALFDDVVRTTGDQTVTGHKIFLGNVTINGDVDVKYVNDVDWNAFLDDIVWINKPQVINSPKTFEGDVTVQKNINVSGMATVGKINSKDLNKFVREAVFIDEPANITGPIIFKNPVKIVGDLNADLINGLNLKTDVVTIMCSDDGPQLITGKKTFRNLKVFGDIYADAVNNYDLQALYDDTLLTDGNQTVTGRKIIHGDVHFKRNVYPDTVNGLVLNRDLVTLDTDQEIEGPLIFQGDINVKKDMLIDGLLNGIDLYNLSRDAVYLETNQVIDGHYTFEKLEAQSVEVKGTVNDIDLVVFDKNVTQFLDETRESLAIMDEHTEHQCLVAKYLQESLENSYYALDSFIFYQDLEFAASFVDVDSETVSLVAVDEFAKATTSIENVWDGKERKFQSRNFSTSSVARKLSYRIENIALTINIGINSKDSSIVADASGYPVALQNNFADASVLLRKTNAVIAIMISDKSTCDIYLLKTDPEKQFSYELDSSLDIDAESTSVVLFEISGILYLAVSSVHVPYSSGFSKVYVKKNGWQLIQRMQASGSFVKHFEYHNYHYLAFANNAPVYETKEPKSIEIYRNSGLHESVFHLFQKVSFEDARGMEVFQFGDISQLHLVTWNETRIQIFGLEGESGMKAMFTIYEKCVRDVKPLLIKNDFYLVVGRQNLVKEDTVTSLLYKGLTKGSKYVKYDLQYC